MEGSGVENYSSMVTGLECHTTYHLRAYATNSVGTAYGDEKVFSTLQCEFDLPTVTTALVTAVTDDSAQCGGEVLDDGGTQVTQRGVCWSTSQDPTITDDHTVDGSGTGSFVSHISGLTPHREYFVRAYAMNAKGTAYGIQQSFITLLADNTMIDYDGNIYPTIAIGSQTWMAKSLNVIHYSDGTPIPHVENQTTWFELEKDEKAYCYYNNDEEFGDPYGALYTWAAAMNGAESSTSVPSGVQGVCPDGWHIPSDDEWKQLEIFLGMTEVLADKEYYRDKDVGGKLKEEGYEHWNSPNTGATNESGFTALAAGHREVVEDGSFIEFGDQNHLWSSSESEDEKAWDRALFHNLWGVGRYRGKKNYGMSVRCIKD
jgi:uncharacterized protein (TIGR02145 family)